MVHAHKGDIIQHGICPMGHGRLYQNRSGASQKQIFHCICLADARKIQHLRPQNHLGIGIHAHEHGIPQGAVGLGSAAEKGLRVFLVGIKMRRTDHSIDTMAEAVAKHGKADSHILRAVIHIGKNVSVKINHACVPFRNMAQASPRGWPMWCVLTITW